MKEIFTAVLERCFLNCYYMNPAIIIDRLKEMTFEKYDVYELEHTNKKAVICIGKPVFGLMPAFHNVSKSGSFAVII